VNILENDSKDISSEAFYQQFSHKSSTQNQQITTETEIVGQNIPDMEITGQDMVKKDEHAHMDLSRNLDNKHGKHTHAEHSHGDNLQKKEIFHSH
jgi:hypothetical protein